MQGAAGVPSEGTAAPPDVAQAPRRGMPLQAVQRSRSAHGAATSRRLAEDSQREAAARRREDGACESHPHRLAQPLPTHAQHLFGCACMQGRGTQAELHALPYSQLQQCKLSVGLLL